MRVSADVREFVLDQLSELRGLRAQSMFGGVGLYAGEAFFGHAGGVGQAGGERGPRGKEADEEDACESEDPRESEAPEVEAHQVEGPMSRTQRA